ncbi:LOG family protein [Geodermatophilus sp. URMC 64]
MRVAVFAGSRTGPPSHCQAAADLGTGLARAGVGIVYGGGHVGLMGSLSDAALSADGEVIGVIPQELVDDELAHPRLSEIEIVMSLHERRVRMADLADAFLVLPGGAGTLAEFFDVWSSGMLGLHAKPTALLDVDGCWRPLLAQLRLLSEDGYLEDRFLGALGVVSNAARLLAFIGTYEHPGRRRRSPGHE